MKERLIEAECPHCHSRYQIKVNTYEIAGNRKLDGLLSSGAFFRHKCGICQNIYVLQFPFLYRFDKETMVVLTRQETIPELGTEKVYRTSSVDDFSETVRILQNKKDPDTIREIKAAIKQKTGRSTVFQEAKDGWFWFGDKDGPLAIKEK